ncbi:response regulator [Desulfuromonas acetoxidans]|nr:response regulator [Desulfuromonas acetoxidans]NVD25258.1 response regulator [Desulfuromonas acetoxidans]NVE17338.1 response regulator [Desulfuromonas acetoxidans]
MSFKQVFFGHKYNGNRIRQPLLSPRHFMPHTATSNIGQKITTIVMLTSTIVLLMSLAASVYIQGTTFQDSMVDKMSTMARIIGDNSKEALALRKSYLAERVINSLELEPSIQLAYLFDRENKVTAQYRNKSESSLAQELKNSPFKIERISEARDSEKMKHFLDLRHLTIYSPVFHEGDYIGCVYLQMSQNLIIRNLLLFAVAALAMLAVTLGVAYLLTTRLKRLITHPLHQLVDRMNEVSSEQNYCCQKMPIINSDIVEIKTLLGGFCHMLKQIEKREKSLQQYSQGLETQVRERTKDLQQTNDELHVTIQELDDAKKAAQEASAAKSRFLANMSHEIRTPMIGVLGMAEQLMSRDLDDQDAELVKTIYSSGESLQAILNDLLDISKIEAGKLELDLHQFTPIETLDQAVELLADNAFKKGLELTTVTHTAVPSTLTGDAGRLRQIILNLLSNAIKFTGDGHIVVDMNWLPTNTTSGNLIVSVKDSGIGLDDAAKNNIFTAFTQADSSTSRKYGGTGLGLTIVKQLVGLMDGDISVRDNEDHGSIFTVTIPFKSIAISPVEPHATTVTTRCAIVASENQQLQHMLREHLEASGISVALCDNAKLAQNKMDKKSLPLDLLLLDSTLPGGAISLLKSLPQDLRPKVIFLGPRSQMFSHEEMSQLGIDTFLPKPVQTTALYQAIAPNTQTAHIKPETKTPAPQRSNNHRILLAEDNDVNQRLVQLILRPLDYQLTVVSNGQQAVEACEKEEFSLILMDCQMPLMDGYEAAQHIRQQVNTPIIALTAHAGEEDVQRCRDAGMIDYLCKPYRQIQLLDMLEKHLKKQVHR